MRTQPLPVLQRQRAIEAHLVRDARQIGLRHAGGQRELRQRPARRQVQHGEADDRDDRQQDQALPEPAEKVARSPTCRLQVAQYHWPMFQQLDAT